MTQRKQVGSLIDANLYRRAKAQAALEGRRVGDLIDQALEEYLSRHGASTQSKFRRTKGLRKEE
jgi:hypothetical protein